MVLVTAVPQVSETTTVYAAASSGDVLAIVYVESVVVGRTMEEPFLRHRKVGGQAPAVAETLKVTGPRSRTVWLCGLAVMVGTWQTTLRFAGALVATPQLVEAMAS